MVRTPLVVRGPAGATSCMTVPYRFVRSLARSYGSWPYLRANDRYGLSLVPGLGGIPVRRPVPGQALVVVWLRVVAPGDIDKNICHFFYSFFLSGLCRNCTRHLNGGWEVEPEGTREN